MPGKLDIMHAIREGLDGMEGFPHSAQFEGYTDWTRRVFTVLCTMGRNTFGCQVGATQTKVRRGTHLDYAEFLYDVTWIEYDGEGWPVNAPLVVECEWSSYLEAIEEDFSKLLLSRSDVRLMVCRRRPDMTPEDMGNYFAKYVQRFRGSQADDVYLLAVVDWDDGSKSYRFEYFTLDLNGALPFPGRDAQA